MNKKNFYCTVLYIFIIVTCTNELRTQNRVQPVWAYKSLQNTILVIRCMLKETAKKITYFYIIM